MNEVGKTQELTPSVLDRLLQPEVGKAAVEHDYYANISQIKKSIRRDLENLLNSRRPLRVEDKTLSADELNIINYGVPDFMGASFATQKEQNELINEIRKTILAYEKRFKSVRIVERRGLDSMDRTVRFRIEAELKVEPAVEPLVFDTEIDPISRQLNVEESRNG